MMNLLCQIIDLLVDVFGVHSFGTILFCFTSSFLSSFFIGRYLISRMRLFVSYTSKDPAITQEALVKIETRLRPFANVFIDRLHNINGGQARVDHELSLCDVLIQIESQGYESEWVKKEVHFARQNHKPIIQTKLDSLLNMSETQMKMSFLRLPLQCGRI